MPLCPIHLCADKECQTCTGFIKPRVVEVTEEDVFAIGLIDQEYEEEDLSDGNAYEENFYTEFYGGTKETMVASYETIASYFGFAEEVEF